MAEAPEAGPFSTVAAAAGRRLRRSTSELAIADWCWSIPAPMLATYTASTDLSPSPASSNAFREAYASISIRVSSSRRPKGIMPAPIIATSLMVSSPFQSGDPLTDRIVIGKLDIFHGFIHQFLWDRTITDHQTWLGFEVDLARQTVGITATQLVWDVSQFEGILDHPAPESDRAFRDDQHLILVHIL